ncbi:MAG TPA: CPBP family intramembrane glutamic endopeptidase [Humisphaera sp.]
MSIIAAQPAHADPAATGAADPTASAIFWGVVVALAAVGAFVGWRLRVHRPRSVLGPARVPPTGEAWPLGVALVGGFLALVVGSSMGLAIAASALGLKPEAAATDESALLAASLVGFVSGLLFAAALLAVISRPSLVALGLSGRHLRRVVPLVAVAALLAIPWTFVVGFVTDWVYRTVDFRHPPEHDLLRTMRDAGRTVRWGAIVSAVVVAPLSEEFFFRGLVQTTIRHSLARLFGRAPAVVPAAAAADTAPTPPAGAVSPPAASHVPAATTDAPAPPPPAPTAWMGWVAIVLTSTLFGAVHPLWTFPIIFFLSLGLGYLYERTGNLWASMGLHAAFNVLNVVLYLAQVS